MFCIIICAILLVFLNQNNFDVAADINIAGAFTETSALKVWSVCLICNFAMHDASFNTTLTIASWLCNPILLMPQCQESNTRAGNFAIQ